MKIANSIADLVGRTPLAALNRLALAQGVHARLFAKLEYLNPAGSVKDRIALSMIKMAEEEGKIGPDAVIIEPTSGNTGIGLAAMAAARGYQVILTMPDTMSVERINMLKAYGVHVVLTDGHKGMRGAIERAEELSAQTPNSFMPSQFENPYNPKAHFDTTGPEIFNDADGRVDCFIAGVGTGGTVTGVGGFLKARLPELHVVAVEPLASPVLLGGTAGAHRIQGIGAGFVPSVLNRDVIDEIIPADHEDAYRLAREMAKLEGYLVGISSGAALWAAVQVGKRPEFAGKNLVVLLPDSGDRYFSTPLFQ